jgi:hypothetical protein
MTSDVQNEVWLDINSRGIRNLSGLEYFTRLLWLSCHDNLLSKLPELPDSLAGLDCSNNQLSSLPGLPADMTGLSCSNNKLLSIPILPGTLIGLYCDNNLLTSLPKLPANLEELDCRQNLLTGFDVTGSILLGYINCSDNYMKSIDNVIGWQSIPGLIKDKTFFFQPQRSGNINSSISNDSPIKDQPVVSIDEPDPPVVQTNPFVDVNKNDWFFDDVLFSFTRGLIKGTNDDTFSPQGTLTRGMLVTILYRNAGEPDISDRSNIFSDAGNAYFTDPIIWAVEKGIAKGYGNGKFGPNDNITRQDLAVILVRYASFIGYKLQSVREYSNFEDDAKILGYAIKAVITLYESGVVNGKGGNIFDPYGIATRIEVAAVLRRLLEPA